MRRTLLLSAVLALLLSAAPVTAAANPGPGYFATDNVDWLGIIPVNADSAGGRLLDGYFYITDDRGLTIYDVAEPASPRLTGFWPAPQNAYFVEEDPDTNGEILLISGFSDLTRGTPASWLFVIDVRDKSLPVLQGTIHHPQAEQHTWSCVLDCAWAYGDAGSIADLRDPSDPRLSEVRWTDVVADAGHTFRRSTHDVTEVAPGLVLTSSNPMLLLDATQPEAPAVLTTAQLPDNRFVHGNLWPNGATDPILLVGGETVGDCNDTTAGAFMTFDASGVDLSEEAVAAGEVGEFTLLDEHRVSTGLYTDGDSPYNQYCAHWFTEHPDFDGAGLVAMAWYEHGVRFLDVGPDGGIEEVGWWVPLGGSTSAAYWVTDEIVYTADYQRGFDILRFSASASGAGGEVRQVRGAGLAGLASGAGLAGPVPARPALPQALTDTLPYTCRLR